jgi:hypothetical protein
MYTWFPGFLNYDIRSEKVTTKSTLGRRGKAGVFKLIVMCNLKKIFWVIKGGDSRWRTAVSLLWKRSIVSALENGWSAIFSPQKIRGKRESYSIYYDNHSQLLILIHGCFLRRRTRSCIYNTENGRVKTRFTIHLFRTSRHYLESIFSFLKYREISPKVKYLPRWNTSPFMH